MEDPTVPPAKCAELLRAAIASHVAYISAAGEGKGVDRHLFGLKQLLDPTQPKPEIFADPANAYSSSWHLSTSQLSSEYFDGYGWSQVLDEGYGIAYMINENNICFNVVCKGLGAERMGYYLSAAAEEMREVMEGAVKAKL